MVESDADPEGDDEPKGRTRQRIDHARETATHRMAGLRDRSAVVDGLAHAWSHDGEVGGGVMAGAVAFRLFLFLVPYVLFMFTAFGTASEVTNRSPEDLASSAGISGLLATGIANTASFSTGQKWVILFVSGYATFMAARSVVKTLVDADCLAWKIPRVRIKKTRPALVFIAFFTITSLLTSELGRLRAAAPTPGVVLTVAWVALPFLSVWWLMAKLPHRNAPTWALIPGAVITAVGFEIVHAVTVWWIAPSTTSKTETYGVIGLSLAVLLWCYIAGRLVIGTTVLNAALWRRYEAKHPDVASSMVASGTSLSERVRSMGSAALDLFR